jgi:two-component system, NtrC family, response regulator AtoC
MPTGATAAERSVVAPPVVRILVVDDEPGLRHTLSQILGGEGHEVSTAADGAQALAALAERDADIVLCDVRMPAVDGLQFLERYLAAGGRALVVMMSAYGDDDHAIAAMQRGAYDYVAKPFRPDQMLMVVRKAIEREGLRRQLERLREQLTELRGPEEIVGRSAALQGGGPVRRRELRRDPRGAARE